MYYNAAYACIINYVYIFSLFCIIYKELLETQKQRDIEIRKLDKEKKEHIQENELKSRAICNYILVLFYFYDVSIQQRLYLIKFMVL